MSHTSLAKHKSEGHPPFIPKKFSSSKKGKMEMTDNIVAVLKEAIEEKSSSIGRSTDLPSVWSS